MLSKNFLKYINALQQKKHRKLHEAFLVEGEKSVAELLASTTYQASHVLGTAEFLQTHRSAQGASGIEWIEASPAELQKAGTFKTAQQALAIAKIPAAPSSPTFPLQQWVLALDGVNDPGNLGTLIRIADWYGFADLICSPDTVDVYNPKTISASMGSFLRVRVHYAALESYLDQCPQPVLGAYLEGESVHTARLPQAGVLVMGSEAHGIRPALSARITQKVTIPRFGAAESLNVAVATAILCDRIRQQHP
ncbi:RNA methyltransferase, TrmH family [Catalinimonas alkaloidigena]|uniref:RNA methyltransferase, TrmH family n=1 Tax=Catalinimonas alkaloidigena TaxID=1075417 RepID=A0A1G9AZ26_9BACT|nr:RNA methyltransferase [Catalinimonas alkaloidigena]SDK32596.1 RNA methyltransferase, TrmH family [Catalinimonas alkaloidigena]